MKTQDIAILGLAGVAVYMILRSQGVSVSGLVGKVTGTAGRSTSGGTSAPDSFVDEIFNAGGLPYDNGWRYYENGTAIDTNGNYYYQGKLVYSAGSTGGATGLW